MKALFTKLSGREQGLLLLFIWSTLLWWAGAALFSSYEQAEEERPAFYITPVDGQPHYYPPSDTADWTLPDKAIEFPAGLVDLDGPRGLIAKLQQYDQHSDAIHEHNQILGEREGIEKSIHERLKSHDNSFTTGKLGSVAEKVARAIDRTGTRFDEAVPRDLGSLFSQHTVEITFKNANWDNLKTYVSKIREFSPSVFLSEVEIEPHYRTGPDGPYLLDYQAVFHVSSLELKKKRF
tara:strand:+ start:1124 stop:1831 length:708 start_codon:yes stop_codon:yes gene_type:complete